MIDSELDLILPYATENAEGIGGTLRARPEYFEVEEIPLYDTTGDGEHLFVNITKVGLTTRQVQDDLARLFGLKSSRVSVAGLKDKYARTTQTFSIHVGQQDASFAKEAIQRIEDRLDVEVNWAEFHRNKLKTGHLLGNRFAIVISEPACDRETCLERCRAVAARLRDRGVPNYFGPQRFGREGGNVKQGLAVISGERSPRDRWLRKFLAGSVQSYLCNRYLAERTRIGMFDSLWPGDVAKKYATGGMFDVIDVDIEQERYAKHEISFTAPVYGPKMWAAKAESGEFEQAIISEAGVDPHAFAQLRINGTRRLGRLLIEDLEIDRHEDGIRLKFRLPKGAYATTVLREFMKNGDTCQDSEYESSADLDES